MKKTTETKKEINKVAIYSKTKVKDEPFVGENQEQDLIRFVTENGWEYEVYREVIQDTDSKLQDCPMLASLLEGINDKRYDAVVAKSPAILIRGKEPKDVRLLFNTLLSNRAYIIAPDKTYDISDINDKILLGIIPFGKNVYLYKTDSCVEEYVEQRKKTPKRFPTYYRKEQEKNMQQKQLSIKREYKVESDV